MKKALVALAVVALMVCALVGYSHYLFNVKLPARVEERMSAIIPDTILIRDTLRIVEPTPTEEIEIGADTVWLERIIKDTILDRDTVYVRVPISQVVYENNRYKAVIQGYHPRLVSLDIYTDKTYVYSHKTIVKPAKLSLSAGIYGGYGPKGFDYGLGIMLGIPIFSWTW